ncbi:MAG: transposase [Phycisphaeraceae bacterium]|nr:MAG: transposase [Phycisphaeraceae bacterium]
MESRLWSIVLDVLPPHDDGPTAFVYDARTVLVFTLWAVLNERPFNWAACPENWPDAFRPRHFPDQSTLSRRRRTPGISAWIERVTDTLADRVAACQRDAAIDSRPMVVGGASKDRDAPAGRGVGGFSRGYRVHMLVDRAGVVRGLRVASINVNERLIARELIASAPRPIQRIIGDANYDSMPLHAVAAGHGRRLYTRIRLGRVGRRAQRRRLLLVRLLETTPGRAAMHARDGIERVFARMSNIACGLKPLPAWVRGLERVSLWIHVKILFYHAYLLTKA